jgi:hypothetical protein
MGGSGGRGPMQFKGTVRWESAKPIRDALKEPLPEAFANHYVISVSGLPFVARRRPAQGEKSDSQPSQAPTVEMLDRIKGLTYLEPKGKSPAQPGIVQPAPGDGRTLLFGFSKEILKLSADDKEVEFRTQFGPMQVKTKFALKDMVYRKELAL